MALIIGISLLLIFLAYLLGYQNGWNSLINEIGGLTKAQKIKLGVLKDEKNIRD